MRLLPFLFFYSIPCSIASEKPSIKVKAVVSSSKQQQERQRQRQQLLQQNVIRLRARLHSASDKDNPLTHEVEDDGGFNEYPMIHGSDVIEEHLLKTTDEEDYADNHKISKFDSYEEYSFQISHVEGSQDNNHRGKHLQDGQNHQRQQQHHYKQQQNKQQEQQQQTEQRKDGRQQKEEILKQQQQTTTTPKYDEILQELNVSSITDNITLSQPFIFENRYHKSIDTGLFEKELTVVNTDRYNRDELRAMLRNLSNLQDDSGERHRDLGSSFILPILKTVNYDNNSAPIAFTDIPVHVSVKLNILYLANFDSSLMEYSIDIEMELSWFDLRLANNYTKPIRIRELNILTQIWRPDPYFVNSKFSYFHHVSFPNFRMRITPAGLVTYTMRVTSICNCFMRFCLYPHDKQVCDMLISSIAFPSSFVRFHWHAIPVQFQSEIALPELHIKKLSTTDCAVEGKLMQSSCLRLVFELERDGGRFVVEKYIPSTLAMMFAWVAPYVPYNYEDVRIVTPITVLLTLVQMEKGDQEIRTSYLTSIDVWFGVMKMFTVFSLLESLIVLALIKRSRAMEKSAVRAANEFIRLQYKTEARRLTRLYHRLDSIARFSSPLVFIVFFVYYVIFIAQGDDGGCVKQRQFLR